MRRSPCSSELWGWSSSTQFLSSSSVTGMVTGVDGAEPINTISSAVSGVNSVFNSRARGVSTMAVRSALGMTRPSMKNSNARSSTAARNNTSSAAPRVSRSGRRLRHTRYTRPATIKCSDTTSRRSMGRRLAFSSRLMVRSTRTAPSSRMLTSCGRRALARLERRITPKMSRTRKTTRRIQIVGFKAYFLTMCSNGPVDDCAGRRAASITEAVTRQPSSMIPSRMMVLGPSTQLAPTRVLPRRWVLG